MKFKILLWLNSSFSLQLKGVLFVWLALGCQLNGFGQANQLIFKDDFSQSTIGINWQPDVFWSIDRGVASNTSDLGSLYSQRSFSESSYVIETTAKGFSYAYWRQFFFTFGQADDSTQKAYVVHYTPVGGGLLTLGRATDNIFYSETLDDAVVYPQFEANRWQKFKIARYKSGLIQVYVDKGSGYGATPLLEAIDSTYQQLGHFGWTLTTQTAGLPFTVDEIKVQTPATEKPAIREKPAADDLITQAVATSRQPYKIEKLKIGAKSYSDRNYTVTALPAYLENASFVQTAMRDKHRTEEDYLAAFFKKDVVVYVAYDSRATAIPAWLAGWEKTNDVLVTTDSVANYLQIYSTVVEGLRLFPQAYFLGGNLASPAAGAEANYLVAAVAKPRSQVLEAEDATVVGAEIAKDHKGYSGSGFVDYIHKNDDYIEWTTQTTLAGTYGLTFTFSNASDSARSMAVTVDGKEAGVYSFIPISSWDSWASYSAAQVYLTPGPHKIRATAIGDSGPNVDNLRLTYFSSGNQTQIAGRYAQKTSQPLEHSASSLRTMAYPNPFATNTTIAYSVPEPAKVCLTVYNQQGQQLKVLVDQVQLPGDYTALFNGQNLPNGLYFYRLQVGAAIQSGKILKK